jgi:hypothetical protein
MIAEAINPEVISNYLPETKSIIYIILFIPLMIDSIEFIHKIIKQ